MEDYKMAGKKSGSKRELIDTGNDKLEDVGRSLSQDVRKHAKTEVPPGQGDRGDQKRDR